MKFRRTDRPWLGAEVKGSRRAFTLAEVLAALVFMAIVIPVALDGLRVASLAGQVGVRKTTAVRIAERVLNEMVATGAWQASSSGGVLREGNLDYQWSLQTRTWPQDTMQEVRVQVTYQVQGRDYDVKLTTLVASGTP